MIKKLKSFSKFEFLYHTLYFVKIILKVIETARKVARSINKIISNFKRVLRDIANSPAHNAILSKLLFRTFDSPLSQQVIKKGAMGKCYEQFSNVGPLTRGYRV